MEGAKAAPTLDGKDRTGWADPGCVLGVGLAPGGGKGLLNECGTLKDTKRSDLTEKSGRAHGKSQQARQRPGKGLSAT